MYSLYLKRLIDFVISFALLIFLSPIFLLVSISLLVSLRGNPFFVQKRPGVNGKLFSLVKFRTMSTEKDSKGMLLPDEKRLGWFGKKIRMASLDEIPQIWNVLKGDMSLIGPRPLLEEYLPLYDPFQSKRHMVRPGITGLAQVNGRNTLSWQDKFQFDVFYVENQSFKLDCQIFAKTISKVLRRDGIHQNGHVTMPKFKGNF
jgi:lipopolysaccharide/colanic/teichoic acid biosynthesis glycosyltransferase